MNKNFKVFEFLSNRIVCNENEIFKWEKNVNLVSEIKFYFRMALFS